MCLHDKLHVSKPCFVSFVIAWALAFFRDLHALSIGSAFLDLQNCNSALDTSGELVDSHNYIRHSELTGNNAPKSSPWSYLELLFSWTWYTSSKRSEKKIKTPLCALCIEFLGWIENHWIFWNRLATKIGISRSKNLHVKWFFANETMLLLSEDRPRYFWEVMASKELGICIYNNSSSTELNT